MKSVGDDSIEQLYCFNLEYGFWGTPKFDREIYYPEYCRSIRVRHDENGNRASFEANLSDKFLGSVLFLGGSHTWGAGVENNATFSALVEKNSNVEVHNFGHCSFGLDQMALVLESKIDELKPSVVIVELHPWVIHRILRKSAIGFPKPYFVPNSKLKVRNLNKLYKIKAIRNIASKYQEFVKEFQEFQQGIVLKEVKSDFMDPIFHSWNQDFYEEMYALSKDLIRHIRVLCRSRKCHLLFVLGPTKQELENLDVNLELIDFSIPRNRILSILDELEIEYLNLLPKFSELLLDEKLPGLYPDGHLNKLGHETVAKEIVRIIDQYV
jgi:hypothetical protein